MPPPPLNIPPSPVIVTVHIIDTTSRIANIPTPIFLDPSYPGFPGLNCPAYSFLIEHAPSGRKFLFDLGVRKDWETLSPAVANRIRNLGWRVTIEKGVAEILREGGVDPGDIEGIIWSHHHWDHTGDPSTFPSSTDLIVGPGFKKELMPAYPTNPDALIRESDFQGRNLREISFADTQTIIGDFPAIDFFDDGSFYLLDAPGHAIGHLCALCRTTAGSDPTFIFLGGDISHHGGEFRPTQYLPLPMELDPNPIPKTHDRHCPGELLAQIHRLHPSPSACTAPFFLPSVSGAKDVEQAKSSITKLTGFDGNQNVLTMIAHDDTMLDVVEFFPKASANAWKEKAWKDKGLWMFLSDFGGVVLSGKES